MRSRQKFGKREEWRRESVCHAKEFELYFKGNGGLLEGFKHKSDLNRTTFLLL